MQEKWTFGVVLGSRFFKSCVRSFSNDATFDACSESLRSAQDIVRCVRKHAPVFALNGDNITVLHEPKQFYAALKVNKI